MTTNREWLYSLDVADLADWFDAEHVEHQDGTLDGDTEPENADSREKLEADVYRAADEMDRFYCGEKFIDTRKIIGWLDRQAAITEEQTRCKWVTASAEEIAAWRSKAEKLKEQVYELTAERDKLQAQVDELTQVAESKRLSFADRIRFVNEIDELTAERDNWKEHSRTIEHRCKKAETDCEIYRKKFGKCLDYADAIHALMDDEGMA